MKKTFKISISLLLSFLMLLSTLAVGYADDEITIPEEWYDYYATADVAAGIHFAPGADETQRQLSWYASADSTEGYVLVSTNEDLEDAVRFDGSFSVTVEKDYSYAVTIKNLEAGTKYYYACFSKDYQSETYSFTTLAEKDFSAIYVNDIHISREKNDPESTSVADNGYVYGKMLESALSVNPEIALILSGGDQASDGTRLEYLGLASPLTMKNIPFAGVIGNHDRKDIAYKDFFNYPNQDTKATFQSHVGSDYWFVKGDALFLMMDSNNSSMGDHERVMEEAIKANPDLKWRIVVFHHELFGGRLPSREQENELLRLIWTPLLTKYNVDMVLSGHSHHYSLSNVMDGKETKTEIDVVDGVGSVTNPGGPIYLASGSINRPRLPNEDDPIGPNAAFTYAETLEPIFNVLNFSENTLTLKAYTSETHVNFLTFTIEKDIPQSERPLGKTPFYYPILKLLGTIAMLGNNIGKYYDYYTGGNFGDRPFSIREAIFGK